MPAFTTEGIVLRRADYRDYDRMLTLLTPRGRVDAIARGCRRPKSPLLAASEVFTSGAFDLYQSRERCAVVACTVRENFYALRLDFDKLACASYIAALCEAAAQPNEDARAMFTLLHRALDYLCEGAVAPRAVIAAFALRFAAALGYQPLLYACASCAKPVEGGRGALFDIEQGGLLCDDCADTLRQGQALSAEALRWLRSCDRDGARVSLPPEDAPLPLLMAYITARLDKRVPPLMANV